MKQAVDAAWVVRTLKAFLDDPTKNNLGKKPYERAFGDPLVGFSRGDDPLYEQFKEHVGPSCLTPSEVFGATFGGAEPVPALTVISWILPQTRATREDNRREVTYPAERWARARIFGEQVNERLRAHLVQALGQAGYRAVAPVQIAAFREQVSPLYGRSSTWSERHVAYAAGLGTFGLCDGLITRVGKAVRIGSVVTDLELPASPRDYAVHQEYCLFYADGSCGSCMTRCPVGAITPAGKDKEACSAHLFQSTQPYVTKTYGFDGYGCGLCQTGVPCEGGVPRRSNQP